jgi:hypothetical protein
VKVSEYIPGTDITVQLRTDLNAGRNVKIPAGHFYISESIIVEGYSGTLKGADKNATIIEAAQGFKGTGEPMFSPSEEVTNMFAFYWSTGDVTCKNLTLLVTGNSPAEAHNNPFLGDLTTIDNAILVAGIHEEAESGITVTFNNLKIKGEDSTDPMSRKGKNLVYPLIVTGLLGAPKPVSTVIKNCEIENSGSDAIAYWAVFGGSGIIKDNEIKNCYSGIRTFSLTDPLTILGEVIMKENIFTNLTKPDRAIRNLNTWSSQCLKDNTLDGILMADDCQ